MSKSIFIAVVLPLVFAIEIFLAYSIGENSEVVRYLVTYEMVMDIIPFLSAYAVSSVYAIWKRLSQAKQLSQVFFAAQAFASAVYIFWPRSGAYLDKGAVIIWSCHLLLIATALGLVWTIWITYTSLHD